MDSSSRSRKRSHSSKKMPKDYCDDDDADESNPAKKCAVEDAVKCAASKVESEVNNDVDPDEYADEETADCEGAARENIDDVAVYGNAVDQDSAINRDGPVDKETAYVEDANAGDIYEAVDIEDVVDEATNYDGYFYKTVDNEGVIDEAPEEIDPYDAINDVKGVKLLDDKASIMKGVKHFYEEDKDKSAGSVPKRRKLTAMENEVNQLKQFLVLDEVNQGSDKDEDEDSSDSEYDCVSDDVPSEELEAMLNAGMPGEYSRPPRIKPCPYDQRKKIVLEEKGVNHFEVLPLGWLVVPHHSGMPLYLHKMSRVCTLAKPYFLGPGSARKHEIPISAIPCYNYRRALEEEQKADSLGDAASYLRKLAVPVPLKRGISVATNLTIIPEKKGFETTVTVPGKEGYEATLNVSEIVKNTTPVIAHVHLSNGMPSGSGIATCPFESNTSGKTDFEASALPTTLEKDGYQATENNSEKEGYEASANSTFANVSGKYGYESSANTQQGKEGYESTANVPGKPGYEATTNVPGKVGYEATANIPGKTGFEATANVPGKEGYKGTVTNGTTETSTMNHKLLRKLVNTDPIANGETVLPMMPNAKVETAQENWRKFHLKHDEVTDYCKKLFKFKCISIMRFKSWSERRKFTKSRKALQRPTLPDGTKLITFPVQTISTNVSDGAPPGALGGGVKAGRKECLMNPSGKSYVCILHEYMQRALKKQPTYEFKELENGATPYSATVSIDEMRYGIGYGTSKRQAKSAAAKAAIEILIPEMREKIMQDKEINGLASRSSDRDLAFFDDIMIEDPRVADFCAKTMEPSPHNVLQTCLARNFGIGDRDIKYEINTLKHQKNQFTMTVGKHTATVICKNKRDGKQRASQAILQALHPNITSWGSLLRLYGTRSVKSFKEKKQEEQEITLLQSRAAINQPNHAILEKLNTEMVKLREMDVEVNPIANYICEEDLPTHSGSNLANVDL